MRREGERSRCSDRRSKPIISFDSNETRPRTTYTTRVKARRQPEEGDTPRRSLRAMRRGSATGRLASGPEAGAHSWFPQSSPKCCR